MLGRIITAVLVAMAISTTATAQDVRSDAELLAVQRGFAVLGMPVGLVVYVVLAMFGKLRWSIGRATLWWVLGAFGGVAVGTILVWVDTTITPL